MKAPRIVLVLSISSGLLLSAPDKERESCGVTITPDVIQIGAFYDGASVKVAGLAENGARIIITVSGADTEERFNQKRRFGFVWINGGRIRISGVPSLFLQFSSAPVRTLLPPHVIERNRLDETATLRPMQIEPRIGARAALLQNQFLSFKREHGAYHFADAGVAMAAAGNSGTPFSLIFHWPKAAPPAAYEVRVYEVKDGAVTRQSETPLRAVRVGFPAWLARLAERHPVHYGVAAVVVAALAGFGIDLLTTKLFGKKRPSRR